MKKAVFFLFLILIAAVGGMLVLFHSERRDWQNIHPNIVYRLKDHHQASWYPLLARVLNLPADGKWQPRRTQQQAADQDRPSPDRVLLALGFDITLKEGGFYYLPAFRQYSPGALVEFANRSADKPLETLFDVELVDPKGGTKYYSTRQFVNLKPGKSMVASFGNREDVLFERPGEAPDLALRFSLPNGYKKLLPIPRRLLRAPK